MKEGVCDFYHCSAGQIQEVYYPIKMLLIFLHIYFPINGKGKQKLQLHCISIYLLHLSAWIALAFDGFISSSRLSIGNRAHHTQSQKIKTYSIWLVAANIFKIFKEVKNIQLPYLDVRFLDPSNMLLLSDLPLSATVLQKVSKQWSFSIIATITQWTTL